MNAGRSEAAFWAAFLRNRNVDAGTAGDGAVAIAGGYALCVRDTALRHALGAGTTRPLRADDCDIAEAFYAARGLPARFELDEPDAMRDRTLLDARGFADEGGALAVLQCDVAADAAGEAAAVRATTDRRGWAALAVRGWDDGAGDVSTPLRTAQIDAAAAQVLVIASLEGEDVGAAALGVVGDTALLFAASVLPAHRGRGVYGALVAARLRHAHARGTSTAIMKTEPDGAAQRSAAHHGFVPVAIRRRVRRDG